MGDKTTIEWTDASWNITRGCTSVSAGCDNCYAAGIALRFSGPGLPYEGLAVKDADGRPRWTGKIMLVPEKLNEPLRWEKPRRIFVNSMSDLFHAGVPRDYIDRVFAVMTLARQHTFQVLTKRPLRMARYLADPRTPTRISHHLKEFWEATGKRDLSYGLSRLAHWPLTNVWVGTSVEDQAAADVRIKHLLKAPAAVRFLSMEPLIGPVDLAPWLWEGGTPHPTAMNLIIDPALHWVIVGGESGPRYRPLDAAWVRSLRDQCEVAGVRYFFKQWGGLRPKANGRLLDGRTWDEYPEVQE